MSLAFLLWVTPLPLALSSVDLTQPYYSCVRSPSESHFLFFPRLTFFFFRERGSEQTRAMGRGVEPHMGCDLTTLSRN